MATPKKAANEALEKVKDQLECAICLQAYTDPKLLSCFHVFCAHCLTQLVVKSRDGTTVTCPECRRPTPLLQSGIAGLQSAFHVHRLFDIRDTLEKVKEPQKAHCENSKCNQAAATGYCRDCGKFICEKCTAAHHLIDELASHQVVSIADIQVDTTSLVPPKRKVMYCPKHSEKKLKIYCETCQELICNDCTISLHPRETHQYALIADVFSKHRDEILANLEPVKQHLETINKALQASNERKKEIGDQRQVIEADIHKRIDQLHQALDQRRAELVGQLDQLTQQKLKNLAAQKDQIELVQTQLSSCLEYVEGSLKTGTEGEILAMKAPVVRQIQMLPAINPDTLNPQERANLHLVEGDAPRMAEAFHKLAAITTVDAAQCYSTGDGLEAATVEENAEVTLHTRDKDGEGVCVTTADITAELLHSRDDTKVKCNVSKLEDSKYLIRYQPVTRGKHHLHIMIGERHTRDSPHTVVVQPKLGNLGKPVRVIGGVRGPWGVAINSKRMLIVAEHEAHCVSIYIPEGEKVRSFGTKGTENGQFNSPCGITVDEDDNVYVVERYNHRVQKFTQSGQHILSLDLNGKGERHFSHPIGIGFNSTNGKLYVCDQCNHKVHILDINLVVLKTFGRHGQGKGQFRRPWGVAFDNDGNAYASDWDNHRIQVFTPEGEYRSQFGGQGNGHGQLLHPTSIAIDQDRVYVTEENNHRVSIFTTTGKFLHSFGTLGQEPGQLANPQGVTIDTHGFILVSDTNNERIQIY